MYDLPDDHPAILRIKELEAIDLQPVDSHHGDPMLSKRDISLLEAYSLWIFTARKTKYKEYTEFMPHYPDWIKSRLFWRIRSGKAPLKFPPPRAYSCPWYEVIEISGPHDTFEPIYPHDKTVTIAQCSYDIISQETTDKTVWTIGYGPYRFKAWNGTRKCSIKGSEPIEEELACGYIECINPEIGIEK